MFNKSMNFLKRLNFYFSSQTFQIWWIISSLKVMKNTKFQLNISKTMPARPKKTQGHGV